MFPPLNTRHRTANTFAYDSIRRAIFEGYIAPGTRLTEQDLVKWLDVSRTPIREALRRLEADGLVRAAPYRGAVVVMPDADDIREEYTVRAALEGLAAELAVQHLKDQDVEELEALTDEIESALGQGDISTFLEVNARFHIRLYTLSGSRRLVTMIEGSWQKVNFYRRFYLVLSEAIQIEKAFHYELLAACRSRDAEQARKIVQNSCLEAAQFMIDAIKRNQS
ncbi:MAG: GntR family transcriptional regulator [Anaerolineae bacterium]|nr:GntR family transcriptional regulator [Anaerolineae bacterium]